MRLVLKWLVIGAVIVVGFLYAIQDLLIYHPRGYGIGEETAALSQRTVKIDYQVDGLREAAFYVPPAGGGRPRRLWIMFGGNGAVILQYRAGLPEQRALADCGFLLVDYPGYGDSEGHASGATIQDNADAALQALATRLGITPKGLPLGVFGHSLGAGAALEFAAAHPEASRIVLVAPFTSLYDMAFRSVGPIALLLHHNFDNRARLAELGQRPARPLVAIFTGDQDQIIPTWMPQKLAHDNPWVAYKTLTGYEHNQIVEQAAPQIAKAMAAMR